MNSSKYPPTRTAPTLDKWRTRRVRPELRWQKEFEELAVISCAHFVWPSFDMQAPGQAGAPLLILYAR